MASRQPLPKPPRSKLVEQYHGEGMTYSQLSEIYGVSPATLSKWFKDYGIKTRGRVEIKVIKGVKHRICKGPLHPEGKWLPLDRFYRNKGKSFGRAPRCALCMNSKARVPFTSTYKGWLTSIVRRLGVMESSRRLGVDEKTLLTWLGRESRISIPKSLNRKNAAAIVKLIGELKITGEVRHRHSIKRGTTVRGEPERPVRSRKDLYHRALGDTDTEYRRNRRRDPEFQEREREREKKRRLARAVGERLTDAA